jgi:hypothetical protein
MDFRIELSTHNMEVIHRNSVTLGTTPSAMIGRLVDDEFGGLLVARSRGASAYSIYQHIESLESMLRNHTR